MVIYGHSICSVTHAPASFYRFWSLRHSIWPTLLVQMASGRTSQCLFSLDTQDRICLVLTPRQSSFPGSLHMGVEKRPLERRRIPAVQSMPFKWDPKARSREFVRFVCVSTGVLYATCTHHLILPGRMLVFVETWSACL
jgi:hypothetical protein